MAISRDEALELLRSGEKGVTEWNRRRKEREDIPDLSKTNLEREYLIGANLSNAVLDGASLRGAKLSHADLREARLNETDLAGSDLSEADLAGAFLIRANLHGANLNGADLGRANLSGAILWWTKLRRTNLGEAHFYETFLSDIDLSETVNIHLVNHGGPSSIDQRTLARSSQLQAEFLRGVGLCDWEIEAAKLHRATTEQERTDIMYRVLELRRDSPISYYSVFISHSHSDKDFAKALHDGLQEHGIRCWLDEKQLRAGDDILDAIDHGIRHWDKVILCCSETALEGSWWVEAEIDKCLEKEQDIRRSERRKVGALVPVTLDRHVFNGWKNGRQSVITRRKIADFTHWEGGAIDEGSLKHLIEALQVDEREPVPESKL